MPPSVMEKQPLVPRHVDEPLKCAVVATAAFTCISGLLLGFDIGVANGALIPVARYFELNASQMEIFIGILNICALPGCCLGGWSADIFGRRQSLGIGALLFLIGNLMMTFASRFVILLVGRALAGVAVGITLVVGPLYTAEMSPAHLRGMLSTNSEVSFNVGIVMGFTSSWAFSGLADAVSWRWMLGVSLVFPVISLLGVSFVLSESPRWLAKRQRLFEAEAVLHALLGPTEAQEVLEKLRLLSKAGVQEVELSWCKMFASAQTRAVLFIGGGVAFFSQATGIETITYYSSIILKEAGMSRDSSLLATVAIGLFKLAAIISSAFVVDRLGRRPLLLVSSFGMGVSMAVLGLAFCFEWSWMHKFIPMVTFVVLFSIGYGPVVYTLNAEIYPNSCRAKGLIFAMSLGRIVSAVVATTFLSLTALLNFAGAFFFYATLAGVAFIFVTAVVPETKGMHLEDLELDDGILLESNYH